MAQFRTAAAASRLSSHAIDRSNVKWFGRVVLIHTSACSRSSVRDFAGGAVALGVRSPGEAVPLCSS